MTEQEEKPQNAELQKRLKEIISQNMQNRFIDKYNKIYSEKFRILDNITKKSEFVEPLADIESKGFKPATEELNKNVKCNYLVNENHWIKFRFRVYQYHYFKLKIIESYSLFKICFHLYLMIVLQSSQDIKITVGIMHFGTGRPQDKLELTLKANDVFIKE